MATVTKTWNFASNAEGLADTGVSSTIAFAWDGTDGDPAGCVKFTTTTAGLVNEQERAYNISLGGTWETWGVPAGKLVTQLEITAAKSKVTTTLELTSAEVAIDVIDSGGFRVHGIADEDLLRFSAPPNTTDLTWQTVTPDPALAVNADKQVSTTDVRLRIDIVINTAEFGSPNETIRLDAITLVITYADAPENINSGFDIRLYNSSNQRMVQENAVFEADFELLERGGYGRGTVLALKGWDDLNAVFNGVERVDVYYEGDLEYRGYVKVPERSIVSEGEFLKLTAYGLMEWLNKIYISRFYIYAVPTDLSVFVDAIIDDYVNVTDGSTTSYVIPSPPLPFDLTTSINTVGFTVTSFDARGMTVAEALSAICELAPGECIWQMRVDTTSPVPMDVLYFGPKPTTTSYYLSLGKEVPEYAHSVDTAGVVNYLRITGGQVSQPNLVTDGSFENPLPTSELVGNLLSEYSFETMVNWTTAGGATQKAENAHTGTYSIELDTNGENVANTTAINISYGTVYVVSIWARNEAGAGPHTLRMEAEGQTSGGVTVTTITADKTLTSTTYVRHTMTVDFSAYSTVAKVFIRFRSQADVSVGDGINIDDAGFYEREGIANASWRYALAGNAVRDYIDWRYVDPFNRWHGAYAVHAKVSSIGAGTDYLEIRTDPKARVPLVAGRVYSVVFRYKDVDASNYVKCAVYEYKADGTSAATTVSTGGSNASAQWNTYLFQFTANANTAEAEIAIRLTGNSDAIFDAVMVIEGDLPTDAYYLKSYPADPGDTTNPWFYDGDRYEATISSEDVYLTLDAAAETSYETYGRLEAQVTNEEVVDEATLLAFATGYFNAHAVPDQQATITVLNPTALIAPDGLVQLVGLQYGPDALFPSRCATTFEQTGFVRQTIDLGQERPDMTELLRVTERRAIDKAQFGRT